MKEEIKPKDVFTHWVVLREAEPRKQNQYYLCRCVCGYEREVFRGSLLAGRSKSCGCKREARQR